MRQPDASLDNLGFGMDFEIARSNILRGGTAGRSADTEPRSGGQRSSARRGVVELAPDANATVLGEVEELAELEAASLDSGTPELADSTTR